MTKWPLMLGQPCLHRSLLMRGIGMHNEWQFQVLGRLAVDLLERAQPLYVRVPEPPELDRFAVWVVQGGEQIHCRTGSRRALRTALPPKGQGRLGPNRTCRTTLLRECVARRQCHFLSFWGNPKSSTVQADSHRLARQPFYTSSEVAREFHLKRLAGND